MADGTAGGVIVLGVLGFVVLRPLARYVFFPNRVCPDCHGEKKILSADGKRFRDCGRCHATGELRRG